METSFPSTAGSPAGSHTGNALDITGGSQGNPKCSYAQYVGDKFYEYVAMAEMIYVLSTNKDARQQLITGIKGSAFFLHQAAEYQDYFAEENEDDAWWADSYASIGDFFGAEDFAKENRKAARKYRDQAQSRRENAKKLYAAANERFKEYFQSLWQELKTRFYDCGWFYAVATTATDATFAVAELAIGAKVASSAIKSLRFVVERLPEGRIKVTAEHVTSGRRYSKSWNNEDLEAKYGKPEDNHAGGVLPEKNRNVPDKPAEDVGKKKREVEADNKQDKDRKKNTLAPKTKTTTKTRGSNTNEIEYDAVTGRPIRAKGVLQEDFGSTKRGDSATKVGKLGNPGDQGGHLAGHRFMGDTPDEGIVPQAGNLNQGAWKTMENEWADWIKKGYQVKYDIKVNPPGAVRPDAFKVKYKIIDPKTKEVKYENRPSFKNKKDQKFKRIKFRDME
ncbi:DNA/RNA non-specific endonuclease [Pseudovibrio sp. Ad37]|uniref:DNA/RNA non-specific endonuclease n=1 Tax=Pseudovibrio sp. Ad37 TaxID=989422 RepID=UPI0007AE789A|nr:DNA/RNA non-specific endonuclease [Pseudovibrio sp. Ad37]KZL25135.1 putative ribonuclease YeeF [Pseudovibrio sp. Ad37]